MKLYDVVANQQYEPTLTQQCRDAVDKVLNDIVFMKRNPETAALIQNKIGQELDKLRKKDPGLQDFKPVVSYDGNGELKIQVQTLCENEVDFIDFNW